jgi:hypothetical protein
MTIGMATTLRNARLNVITTTADAGGGAAVLTIYNGTRPATGGTATTALVALTCSTTFAPAASGGVLTLNAITNGTATNTSTATWARLTDSASNFVFDMSVGTSAADLILNSTSISTGATVSISSATLTDGNP